MVVASELRRRRLQLQLSQQQFAELLDVSVETYRTYLWKKKFGSLGVPEVRELRQMREENAGSSDSSPT